MTVRVLFFASLRDVTGTDELQLAVAQPVSIQSLLTLLDQSLGAQAAEAVRGENVKIAVNQSLVSGAVMIQPGDEVAFLPPVTGG